MKLANDVTISGLYIEINKIYQSNNHISTVTVEFDDGANKVKIAYKTPPGFKENQMERKGLVELIM